MIFQPQLAKLVLQGRKSQTRRKVQPGKQPRYQAGKSYAIQPGRGKPAVGRITVTDVQIAYLGDIDLRDAKREGFATRQEFVDYWTSLHGRFDPDVRVWVISFLLGDRTDTGRFLAARPGPPHGDYVTVAALGANGEGEPVSEMEQARITKEAHERYSNRAKDPLMREHDEIARALERMRAVLGDRRDQTLGRQIWRMEQQLRTLDRKIREAA